MINFILYFSKNFVTYSMTQAQALKYGQCTREYKIDGPFPEKHVCPCRGFQFFSKLTFSLDFHLILFTISSILNFFLFTLLEINFLLHHSPPPPFFINDPQRAREVIFLEKPNNKVVFLSSTIVFSVFSVFLEPDF